MRETRECTEDGADITPSANEGTTAWGRPDAAQEVTPARPPEYPGVRLPPSEHGATTEKRLSEPLDLTKDAIDCFASRLGSSSSRIRNSSNGYTFIEEHWPTYLVTLECRQASD